MKQLLLFGLLTVCGCVVSSANNSNYRLREHEGALYANTPMGIYRYDPASGKSVENPESWEIVAFEGRNVESFVINGDKICAGIGNILATSTDKETNTDEIAGSDFGWADGVYLSLSQHPKDANRLVAIFKNRLYGSDDFGETWTPLELKADERETMWPVSVCFNPNAENSIVAAFRTCISGTILAVSGKGGMQKDWNASFEFPGEIPAFDRVYFVPGEEHRMFATGYKFLASTSDSWETSGSYPLSDPKIDYPWESSISTCMAFGADGKCYMYHYDEFENDGNVFKTRFYYSKDNGDTWQRVYEKEGEEQNPICDMIVYDGKLLVLYAGEQPVVKVFDVDNIGVVRAVTDGNAEISVQGLTIYIKGIADGATVDIYDTCGVNVYKGVAREVELPAQGIYIVKADGAAYKVAVR